MTLSQTPLDNLSNNGFKKFAPFATKLVLSLAAVLLVLFGVNFLLNKYLPKNNVSTEWVPSHSVEVGNKESKVKLVEFFDLQCPSCKDNNPKIKNLTEKYKTRMSFVYRNFPLVDSHPFAQIAAEAAQAAAKQGSDKYLKFIDEVYLIQSQISNDGIRSSAVAAGLDIDKWEKDKNSKAVTEEVNSDKEFIINQTLPNSTLAKGNKASGTPTVVLLVDGSPKSWWAGSLEESTQEAEILKYLQ